MRKIPDLEIINRDDFLIESCRGKSVLHIGCTDYPITASKIEQGKLLHQKLSQVASHIVGLDIDKAGIEALSKAMPGKDFIVHSAEKIGECEALKEKDFDIIIAADVIEHLSNIGLFLEGIRGLLRTQARLLITAPQAFSVKRILPLAFMQYERVHPDHIAYFSIATLSQLLSRFDLEIEKSFAFNWYNPTLKNRFANSLVLPFVLLSRGRLCDELAIVVKLV
jgi:2-polyprenyl-3-methyl-5-hydroxy-6-metoxy-1,4-benzoquinol methylase